MSFFQGQNLRSDEPVLSVRAKKVTLHKLNLPDIKCCECVPDAIMYGISFSKDGKHIPLENVYEPISEKVQD